METPEALLRLVSMFGSGLPMSSAPTPNAAQPPQEDVVSRIMGQYQPQTQISEQYRDLLSNPPERTDPGMLGKIFGTMSALGAGAHPAGIVGGQPIGFIAGKPSEIAQGYDQTAYAPYYRDMEDWTNKSKALGLGAAEEDRANANSRGVLLGAARQATAEDRANSYATRIENQRVDSEGRLANAEERTKAYKDLSAARIWKLKHPNEILKENDKGQIISIDLTTGTSTVVTDEDTGEPVKSANLPLPEKIKLQVHGRLQEIGAKGAEDRKTEETRQEGRSELEDKRQEGRIDVVDERADKAPARGSTASGANSATQGNARALGRAKEALIQHPEWKDYIQITKAGTQFTFGAPAWYKGGADKATMDQIHDYIYGASPAAKPTGSPAPATTAPVKDDENLTVYDIKTGKVYGTIRKSDPNLAKLDRTKYRVQ